MRGVGRWWLQQAARPEPAGGHDVDLCRVQGQLRAQIQPEQQAKHDREHPIHLAGMTQVVADQKPTDGLQDLPHHPRDQGTGKQLPGRDLPRGQHPEHQQEQPNVDRGRGREIARATATARPP
jgi:hypothetical protein